jgi:hypothetical protein
MGLHIATTTKMGHPGLGQIATNIIICDKQFESIALNI